MEQTMFFCIRPWFPPEQSLFENLEWEHKLFTRTNLYFHAPLLLAGNLAA